MIHLQRTDSTNKGFTELIQLLDADLREKDGDDHPFYAQFNKVNMIKYVVVAYENEVAIACGAIKEYDAQTMEVKRMFTLPQCRGKNVATEVLMELEKWAGELKFEKCILETGIKQESAVALYLKNGYRKIPNYGQYAGVENSLCFEKLV